MKTRSNWWMALMAAALAAYVALVERRLGVRVSGPGGAVSSFVPIPAPEVTGLELAASNRVVSAQRSQPGGPWRLRQPLDTGADDARVESLLQALGRLQPGSYLGPAEVAAGGGARAFGLDASGGARLIATLRDGSAVILQLGLRTLGGNRFYLQRVGDPGVFVADAALLDALPSSPEDWRDRALVPPVRGGFDRLELKGVAEFRAERDASGTWRLRRPLDARADSERINALVAQLEQLRIGQFLSDRPVADLESYGLQAPVAEVVLGRGAQDLVQLAVGSVLTNDPLHRYALRRTGTNLVTVPARVLEPLSQPLAQFRDRRLLGEVVGVTTLEFAGAGGQPGFRVQRTNANATNWWVTAPRRFPADPAVVDFLLRQFGLLEVAEFTADVVPDLSRHGLAPPTRSYRLLSGTNLLAELQLGTPVAGRPTLISARRPDEASVYGLPISVTGQLAHVAGQLRGWRFVATNVARVRVRRGDGSGELVRTNGGWASPRGRLDPIPALNLDATLNGLGALRSDRHALGDPAQEQQFRRVYRLDESPLSVTLEMGPAAGFARWSLEFGGEIGASRVALVRFDDDPSPLRVQVPIILFEDLIRDLAW